MLVTEPSKIMQYFPTFLHNIGLTQLSQKEFIILTGSFIIAIFCIKAFVGYVVQKSIVAFSYFQQARLQNRLIKTYQSIPYQFHLQRNSATLVNAIQIYTDSFTTNTLICALRVTANLLILLVLTGLLLVTNPLPLLSMVGFLLIVLFIYDKGIKNSLKQAGKLVADLSSKIIQDINQIISGFMEIRVLGKESFFHDKIQNNIIQYAKANSLKAALQFVPRYLIESVMVIFVVVLSIVFILVKGEAVSVLPILASFTAAGVRLVPSANQVMQGITELRFGVPVLNSLYKELNLMNIFKNESLKNNNTFKPFFASFNKLQLKSVTYQYNMAKQSALYQISISIYRGQSIGLIGASGAGKSTLVNVILGLLTPTAGIVTVDDVDIHKNLRAWLDHVAYIPQMIFIMDDTIRRNVAFGIPDEDIQEDRLMKAIKMSRLEEVVKQLPNGLDSLLGEHGIRLSGGQRQRVALARAFYHERDLIIMDEATSALDNETECEIIRSIEALKGQKTLIVIAHRLSTVKHCDVLYRLEQGKIVSYGKYEEVVT